MFVPTSGASVAANTEGTRFGPFAVKSERASLKLQRLAHLRARNRRIIAAAVACREPKVPTLSAAERASRPTHVSRTCVGFTSGSLAECCVLSCRSARAFLVGCCRRRLDADSDRPLPQALEPRTQKSRVLGALLLEPVKREQLAPDVQAPECHAVLPNPSLERTATGKALGPRNGQYHHPSRGPSASPASAAQLKR